MIARTLFRACVSFATLKEYRLPQPDLNILEHVHIIFITQYQRIKLDASRFAQT